MSIQVKSFALALFSATTLFLTTEVHARKITLDIPDQDIAIVENDVVDAEQWIKEAWTGKLNKCRDRMITAETTRSIQAGETLPNSSSAIISKAMKRSDYKNRKQRDAALKSR